MSSSVSHLLAYNLIKPVMESFNGDVERFYPNFYKFLMMLTIFLEGLIATAHVF